MDIDPIGEVMASIAACGAAGLFGIALAERFVPVLPSYGLLVAVGIAAAEGAWSLPAALLASITGSLLGCIICYWLAKALGEARSRALLYRGGRLFGLSAGRIERWTASLCDNQARFAIAAQLVPTVRLLAPWLAGLLRVKAARFVTASACGVALWNSIFIGLGVATSTVLDVANASVLALIVLLLLVFSEGVFVVIWTHWRPAVSEGTRINDQ
ncbi:membrane protein DedA with SNARE-associated domain [Rhizobium azibense]|uniref:Membrane protein DedA with SNARE-associated domain n=1 Tax=Rhizobium azibense TaxID=1136135 RepID=A0A4R3Q1P1_9HYPH|nr:DedA family protein [Rhizobium azibense]TCU14970.1 membrane protein DedA with SNARE-associated domain [Rhizobium azibense]TCU31359.1 membrane protein DedA with SNARE-associated domain [Rhizobium azibense]